MIVPDTYCWTNPYVNGWIVDFYGRHFRDLFGTKVFTEAHFRELLANNQHPEYMLKWNFDSDRAAMVAVCRELGINVAFGEDGFFPHYSAVHLDPLGFCWESSLTRMVFRGITDRQRARAQAARSQWLMTADKEMPTTVRSPFVLWPLQIIEDQVNAWDLRMSEWNSLICHLRAALPDDFQLVIKQHPLASDTEAKKLEGLLKELPNTVMLPKEVHLPTLLRACRGVVGVNSSVLYEARLMHQKPTWCYGRSWFTYHTELFVPISLHEDRPLPCLDWLDEPDRMRTAWLDDYCDWFLAQLLIRQFDHKSAERKPVNFKKKIQSLSWHAYREHGEAIFD